MLTRNCKTHPEYTTFFHTSKPRIIMDTVTNRSKNIANAKAALDRANGPADEYPGIEMSTTEIDMLVDLSDADGVWVMMRDNGYHVAADYIEDKYFG